MALRLVLDTNVWLDWLVFADPEVAPLRAAVAGGAAELLIDARCEAELERVLARPLGRWALDATGREARLAECRRLARRLEPGPVPPGALPACRDREDQKFLELALAGGADVLVTKDRALLELARRVPFRILAPLELNGALAQPGA